MGRFVAAELFKSKNENRPIKDLIGNFDKNSSDSPGNRDLINNIKKPVMKWRASSQNRWFIIFIDFIIL